MMWKQQIDQRLERVLDQHPVEDVMSLMNDLALLYLLFLIQYEFNDCFFTVILY